MVWMREETSLLCQQECAEGQAAEDLLLEGHLGRRCCEGVARLKGCAGSEERRKFKS